MLHRRKRRLGLQAFAACLVAALATGCHIAPHPSVCSQPSINVPADGTPRELYKAYLPPYRIEPPDILVIEAVNLTPRSPYRLRASDVLSVQAGGTFADAPIQGPYAIQPGGTVELGVEYGSVQVAGMTLEEAQEAILAKLRESLADPRVTVTIAQLAAVQQIQGEHLVKPDGTVRLGSYGSVSVVGMTLDQAEAAVEAHLKDQLEQPDVSLDVFAFNSKTYYVILQGGGFGDQVLRFPFTGNETVLDALSQVGGLSQVSSKHIWVARPSSNWHGEDNVLPVNYDSIARLGDVSTNYQLLPGDRLYIQENPLVALDSGLAKLLAPAERAMGFSLLGVGTVTRFSGKVLRGGGNPGGGGGF